MFVNKEKINYLYYYIYVNSATLKMYDFIVCNVELDFVEIELFTFHKICVYFYDRERLTFFKCIYDI